MWVLKTVDAEYRESYKKEFADRKELVDYLIEMLRWKHSDRDEYYSEDLTIRMNDFLCCQIQYHNTSLEDLACVWEDDKESTYEMIGGFKLRSIIKLLDEGELFYNQTEDYMCPMYLCVEEK